MSPKSVMPVRPSRSSSSTLVGARSLCTTWARSRGSTGATCSSKRSSTASIAVRRSAATAGSQGRSCGSRLMSQVWGRVAAGWAKPRSPCPSRALVRPHSRRWAASSSSPSGCRPSNQVSTQANEGRPSRPLSRTHCRPSRVGTGVGTGSSGATVRRWWSAEHCRSTTSSGSAGLCTLSRWRTEPDSRRKLLSRSPCRGVRSPDRPQSDSTDASSASGSRSGAGTDSGSSGVALTRDIMLLDRRGGAGTRGGVRPVRTTCIR